MKCSNCDQDLLPGAAFCGNCGAKIVSAASSVPARNQDLAQPQIDQPQQPENTNQQTLNTPIFNPAGQGSTVAVPSVNKSGLSIASMVLGIISIPFIFYAYLGFILGLLAIIFGIVGRKKGEKTIAMAGIITGSIGLSLSIAYLLFVFITLSQL